jgi:hypothetical protein
MQASWTEIKDGQVYVYVRGRLVAKLRTNGADFVLFQIAPAQAVRPRFQLYSVAKVYMNGVELKEDR